jgi:short-subunit dehydrogenase
MLRSQFEIDVVGFPVDAAATDAADKICSDLGDREIGLRVYNCAAEPGGMFLESTTEEQLHNFAVNCVTPTLLIHRIANQMAGRGRGGIVVCSSLAAMQGIYNRVIYGAAKAYEMLLGEGLWAELDQNGVFACSFMIGSTYTPNFIRDQKARNTIFAEKRIPDDATEGMPIPQTPEEAAANLFGQLDTEWLPLVFANPKDRARYEQLALADRAIAISRMRDMFLGGYRSLENEQKA